MAAPTQISMSSPDLTGAEIAAVRQVLETPVLSIGPQLTAFEQAVATYVGVPHAVGVNSGTSGLHLALIAAGVQEADMVILPPSSFTPSATSILSERPIPILFELAPATGNFTP